jgi:hypothetical protein
MKQHSKLATLVGCLLLAAGITVQAQSIFTEDFETDGLNTRYTAPDGSGSDGGEDYFDRVSNSTTDRGYTNVQGEFYWGAQDIDDGDAAGTAPATVLFSGIDISGQSDLEFSAFFAEERPEASSDDDIDVGDFVLVEYQIDGGGWQNLIAFQNDGSTFNTTFLEDTDFDGTGDGTQLETAFAQFTKPIAGTGSSLDLRFTISVDSGDEDFAFDSVTITGTSGPADTTPPTLSSTSPTDDAIDVDTNASISITLNEAIQAGSGTITLHLASDDSVVETFDVSSDVNISGDTATVTPTSSLSLSTVYYVNVAAGALEDTAGNDFAGIADTTTFNFTTGADIIGTDTAVGTVTIELGGPDDTDTFYAQADLDGDFDNYSLAEFLIDASDFGGVSISDISSVELDLTVNDRSFSASGDFFLLFTTDSKADLNDYAGLVYDSNATYGIATAEFTDLPVLIGATPTPIPTMEQPTAARSSPTRSTSLPSKPTCSTRSTPVNPFTS